ncbi:MAG TPA: hypothetical protein VGL89_04145 [Candidatus Koribacter sp.]|jgi:hypothetical protein
MKPAVLLLLFTLPAYAQHFSARSVCPVSQIHQTLTVPDSPEHTVSLDQRQCHWLQPLELAGQRTSDYTTYGVDDVHAATAHDHGYATGSTSTSAQYFLEYDGGSEMNHGAPVRLSGTWKFTGGTASLCGLTGSGTYRAQPNAEGGMEFLMEGNYEIIRDACPANKP